MDELGALVEERGVVFIALDDEPLGVGEAGPLLEIARDAPDEERGVKARVLEGPCKEGRGGGLAVGAGDDERAASADEKLLEQLGQRAVAKPLVEHGLGLGVAARDGIAHDHEVGVVGEVVGVVGRGDGDAPCGEEPGHGRVDVLVGAGDGEASLLHGGRGAGHGGAGDADEVDAPYGCEHGGRGWAGVASGQSETRKVPGCCRASHVLAREGGKPATCKRAGCGRLRAHAPSQRMGIRGTAFFASWREGFPAACILGSLREAAWVFPRQDAMTA